VTLLLWASALSLLAHDAATAEVCCLLVSRTGPQ